jgi:hypothetical protein
MEFTVIKFNSDMDKITLRLHFQLLDSLVVFQ